MPRCSAFLICLSSRLCPIRPYGAPSPRGEGFVRRYAFSTYACIRFDVMGEAVFSYRSLPLEGKALSVVILFSHMRVFALTLWRKRCSRIVAFPLRGRLTMRGKPAVKRSSGIAPYIFAAKPPPQPTTLNPEPRTLKSLVKQNPLTRAFSSCIITSVVVMNYVY